MTYRYLITLLLAMWVVPSVSFTEPSRIALFPQQNDIRNTLNLSGIWQSRKDSLEVGEQENWQNGL